MNDKNIISKIIIKNRLRLGYSQKQFADLLQVPHTTFREWESVRKIQDPENLVKLANVCQISVHELITGEKTKKLSSL